MNAIEDILDDEYDACVASSKTSSKYNFGTRIKLNVTLSTDQRREMELLYVSPKYVNVVKGKHLDLSFIFGETCTP
ncbi:hypothetical protein B4U80_03150 [Leptotrombidium deliense]|uniref:Uncharacterized protein n=1 Tax=Leptotrombidium deliense TaxID=299467 RepID=A0A443RU88_9ACAR|nr:hypothetical protein B4U80_03150 [Leptotrombidium deliense]